MGKAKRKRDQGMEPFGTFAGKADEALRRLLTSDAYDTLLFGPTAQELGETDWRFMSFAGCGCNRREDANGLEMRGPDFESVERMRQAMIVGTTRLSRPTIAHNFDCELALAEFGMAIWPDRFTPIYAAIMAERASWTRLH